jgi:tetrapyrrole methylase family protein/MazG family protein
MSPARIVVVGLGPGDEAYLTERTRDLISTAPTVRFRTARHPAVAAFGDVESYDHLYEAGESFDEVYQAIAENLVSLAQGSDDPVVYVVPGSPVVAERSVEILRERSDVEVSLEPAISVIEVVLCALGRDPMSVGLRIEDALGDSPSIRGPGPILVLQTFSPAVMSLLSDRIPRGTLVQVLHHVGLPDEKIVDLPAERLGSFEEADHLTSVWINEVRTPGVAMDDLAELMETLRRECLWDQEQTHASLTRHLIEEAYEALDALDYYVDHDSPDAAAHVEEELGDLLFQIVFHAELGREEGRFHLASIADRVRDKLVYRHPHVFGDVDVIDSDDVAARWEVLKQDEKQRESVTDGIATQLPALTLYAKLRRKAHLMDGAPAQGELLRSRAISVLKRLSLPDDVTADAVVDAESSMAWGELLAVVSDIAREAGVDLEAALRHQALRLRDEIRSREGLSAAPPEANG